MPDSDPDVVFAMAKLYAASVYGIECKMTDVFVSSGHKALRLIRRMPGTVVTLGQIGSIGSGWIALTTIEYVTRKIDEFCYDFGIPRRQPHDRA